MAKRIRAGVDVTGTCDLARGLQAAGVICTAWHFLSDDEVLIVAEHPDAARYVETLTATIRASHRRRQAAVEPSP